MKRSIVQLTSKRYLADCIFACSAFALYCGASPRNALTRRPPAILPDLDAPDLPKEQATGGEREAAMQPVGMEAITQATAVAKTDRAPRATTAGNGARLCREGDMLDYDRPTATSGDHGGWKGPYPVIRNRLGRGQIIAKVRSRQISAQHPDARRALKFLGREN